MSKNSGPFNRSVAIKLFTIVLCIPVKIALAEDSCQPFILQGDKLIIEVPGGSLQSGTLASVIAGLAGNEQLSVDFSASQVCTKQDVAQLTPADSAPYALNIQAQEVAVSAVIAGSAEVWLRLSPDYQSELLLERSVGEEIGLTDMEFLSDNSGVGAEDFFAEQVDYLELGSQSLDAPFAEVPRFGVEYSHYEESVNQSSEGFVATQGILGFDLLRSLTLTFSPAQGLVEFAR